MYFSVYSCSLLKKLYILYKSININISNSIIFEILKKNQLQIIWRLDSKNIIYTNVKICTKKYTKEKIIVSIKFMIDVLSTFSNEKLFIKKKENTLNIYSQHGTYEVPIHDFDSKNHKNILMIWRSKNYSFIKIYSNILLRVLNKTLFLLEREELELKPILNGVFFKFFPNEANFIATDTYRLVKYTVKNFKTDQNVQFTISRKYLYIIREILKKEKKSNIIIEYCDKKNIIFRFKNYIFSCQQIHEEYPDYHSIIPHNHKCNTSIVINKFLFLNTIKRASIFRINFIDFHFSHNKLKIFDQKTINTPISEIKCQIVQNNLKSLKIGFNSKFLIEILSYLNEDFVYFELYDRMGVIRPFSLYNKEKEESIFTLIMSTIKI
ncbi:DNA polymerase III subunit beta [Blattabacterium sp. (Blaberus giganteus)]|uniref:DNA polymerase III subunit beta n=1 Tax=Blattabacterium sp. (Blaberus giganteus) TaxID=1186051 RepID=UPI00025F7053|nr:DNA polymerase III subunit beta [Blattabacterium sp. (Blaberus giganteus)]AFJ91003.1 DNA polymerase III subunit beta [Blattabacterium sp. (Blaberus giganteus)]